MLAPQNLVSDRPPVQSLLRVTLNVLLGFVIIGPVLGLSVASIFYEGDLLQDISAVADKPGLISALLIMQGIVTFIALIVLPILHITRLEGKPLKPFFPTQPQMLTVLIMVAAVGFAFPVSMSPLVEWNLNVKFPEFLSWFEDWATEEEARLAKLTDLLTGSITTPGRLLVGILVIAILPAIGEELVFRGMIQQELWRSTRNIHTAIWVSAAVFSAIHMQFYGFIPRMLLGALFGYLFYWSGNLWIPIFSHFFNNAFAVIMVYLNNIKVTDINVEDGQSFPLTSILAATAATAGLLYLVWKHYRDLAIRSAGQAL